MDFCHNPQLEKSCQKIKIKAQKAQCLLFPKLDSIGKLQILNINRIDILLMFSADFENGQSNCE